MPTPSGERSVQDAIEAGKVYIEASGLKGQLWHKCSTSSTNCTCHLNDQLAGLALSIDRILQAYGRSEDG